VSASLVVVSRAAFVALVLGFAASTAGAAAPLARSGLVAFSREMGDNVVYPQIYVISARGSQRRQVSRSTAYGRNGHRTAGESPIRSLEAST
jgi:hypothetical protein